MRIGQTVKVLSLSDSFGDQKFIGKVGFVIRKETQGLTGESPDDPFYIVQLKDGRRDGFWTEELQPIEERWR